MDRQLDEFVMYHGSRLFDGAVDVSWLIQDRQKARSAANAYVFHGPAYHGVDQQDIGIGHGHRLIDTASFALQVIRRSNGSEERPFTLAIAGYGTGKSHLATAISVLLSEPTSEYAHNILANLEVADAEIHNAAYHELASMNAPALVVSLNGMGNFDLAAEFTRQIMYYLRIAGVDSRALEELRPRFKTAANLVLRLTPDEGEELSNQCGVADISEVAVRLQEQNETVYSITHTYLSKLGFPIKAIGDETVKDVIETVCREYIGDGQPFSRLVVLFDEFGQYAKFATMRSQIAGSGVLQQLFEGIQTNADKATFVGFIQFDLNTYVQRLGQEYRNEILRVSTRYQSSEKAYLSINLETLLAHLLAKKDPAGLDRHFDCEEERTVSKTCMNQLNAWFPLSSHHRLWTDASSFHQIVRKGCWPLSPYAGWLLFHLAAAGQHLQQRSALSLLNEAFNRHRTDSISGFDWQLHATDIWSSDLERELLLTEEGGNSGAITHAYTNVMAKAGQHIAGIEEKLLRAIVLASKLGLVAQDRNEALEALAAISGLSTQTAERYLKTLEDERNILNWDERFKQFEIIGDTVSRPQFLAFLRQRISEKYDAHGKSQLFLRRAEEFCPEVLCDRTCDFSESHNISTMEWSFTAAIANLDELPRILEEAAKNWVNVTAIDQPRGTIVYCYVEPESDIERIQNQTASILKHLTRSEGMREPPMLVVFLYDNDGMVGQCMAELTVLTEDLSEQDKLRFGNLISTHRQKCLDLLTSSLEDLIRKRYYTALKLTEQTSSRLGAFCTSIFEAIYPKVLPFPFDGFSTPRGNAADTCCSLTLELIRGHLTYNDVMTKAVRDKNRTIEVLNNCWQAFRRNGDISQRPNHEAVRAIFSAWESGLKDHGGIISMAELLRIACQPPFGANLASAGLLLAVYLCARQKTFDVRKGDSTYELSDLSGDILFRGKLLDISKLTLLELVPRTNEEGSEWDTFLDEWEAAADRSYDEQIEYLERSTDVKGRVNPPRSQIYRISLLETKAKEAKAKVKAFDDKVSNAYERIDSSARRFDLHGLTFGAVKLKEALEQMRADQFFSQGNIERYQGEVDLICQRTIQVFDSWLSKQAPRGRTTKDASDFERYMRETATNLKKLGLTKLVDNVDRYTADALRQINALAEAQTLADNVKGWLTGHSASRALRVVDLRNNADTAKEQLKKVSEILNRFQIPTLGEVKETLSEFIKETKKHEKEFMARLVKILDAKFALNTIDDLIQEVDDLEQIFERCDSDVNDLRMMRRSLNFYKDATARLSNENLSEDTFDSLWKELMVKAEEIASDEPPWMPDDVMPLIYKESLRKRKELGLTWLTHMENEVSEMSGLDIALVNNLHSRLQQMPTYLTQSQQTKAKKLHSQVESYLSNLKVEWLLEKYQELDSGSKAAFLKAISVKAGV